MDRLERHPGLSVAAGLIGCVAVIPLAVLLAITILLIPLILLEMVFVLASVFLGTAALALLIGRRLCELVSPSTTPSPLVALLCGVALITAAELVPVVGALVLILVGLIGSRSDDPLLCGEIAKRPGRRAADKRTTDDRCLSYAAMTTISRAAKFAERTARLRASTIREMLKVTQQPDVISFGGGLPAPELFPIEAIAEAVRMVMLLRGPAALQYSVTEGIPRCANGWRNV